jgi:hypothetical protein
MPKKARKTKLSGAEKKADTIRQRQDLLKRKLLEILEEAPNLGAALSRVGINRSTFSRWREDDPNFSLDANQAIERAIDHTADNVELALLASARDGKVPAQKYYLHNNHPRYMPKRWEEQVANPLTEERKQQIYTAMKAWDDAHKDYADEREEDYDGSGDDVYHPSGSPYDENGNLKN